MTSKEHNLSKMMIIYLLMYNTKKPTRAVSEALEKLQAKFRVVMKSESSSWQIARDDQIKKYADAWENTSLGEIDGREMSVGVLISKIYYSMDIKWQRKWIGIKVMERALNSYHSAKLDGLVQSEVESAAQQLSIELLRLYDGEDKRLSSFASRIKLMKKTKEFDDILEGKQ